MKLQRYAARMFSLLIRKSPSNTTFTAIGIAIVFLVLTFFLSLYFRFVNNLQKKIFRKVMKT